MQLQSSQSTGPALSYSRKEILHQNIIQLISHPLLLVSLGFFSFTQVFRLCTLSERNPFVSLIQLLSTWGIHDPTIVEPLTSLSNTIQFSQLILLIPALAIAACLWLISLNAKTDGHIHLYRIGFTAVQIVLFNLMIVGIFFIPFASVKIWSVLETVKEWSANLNMYDVLQWITTGKVLLVVAALGLLYFMFRILVMFSVMKESVCESTVILPASLYVTVFCFTLAGISLILQIKFGFDIISILDCVAIILFAIYILYYSKQMGKFEHIG